MSDHGQRLGTALGALGKRSRTVRQVRVTGWGLLIASLVLLGLFVSRAVVRGKWGTDILPFSGWTLAAVAALAIGLLVLGLRILVRFRGASSDELARSVDRRKGLDDLLAAGIAAQDLDGAIAREVERQAADAVERISPDELFPAKKSVAGLIAVVPLLFSSLYVTHLPPPMGGGIPIDSHDPRGYTGDPGMGGAPGENRPPGGQPGEEGAEENSGEEGAGVEAVPPDVFGIIVHPEKNPFSREDLVTLHILANPEAPAARDHEYELSLVIDGEEFKTEKKMAIPPGLDGALESIYAKLIPGAGKKLTPGKHTVVAVLREGEQTLASEPVEIEIEKDDDKGGGEDDKPEPKPQPQPQPQPQGTPPMPDMQAKEKFVDPLFRDEGMEKKKGWALVPDPKAPAGTPPRRVPLDQVAKEMEKREESEVPVERVKESDRELVRRYFEILKDAGK